MKKALALILAAMMVAGTSAVAFAATPDVAVDPASPTYVWDSEERIYVVDGNIEYGDSLAFDLTGVDAQESSKNKGYKVFPDWSVGESLVEDSKIERVKVRTYTTTYTMVAVSAEVNGTTYTKGQPMTKEDYDAYIKALKDQGVLASDLVNYAKTETKTGSEYRFMAVVDLKDSTTTKVSDLVGDIRVGKTSSAAKNAADEGFYVELNAEVKHYSENAGSEENDSVSVICDSNNVNFVLDIDKDADVTDIEFGKDGNLALFTVDLNGQSDVNVGYSTKFNADVADKYDEANLEFLNFTASPVFNRTGDLYIYADEDSFIYEVTADGLKEIKNAEYDEDYGAWYLRTRKLTSYVISDVELDLTAEDEASSSETSSSNPVTGGTTGTTEGNTNVKPNPNTGR